MAIHDFKSLMTHFGHKLEVVTYGKPDPETVAIECRDCEEIVASYEEDSDPDLILELTLSVAYRLRGEKPEAMIANLNGMVEHAIGNGLLTGMTDAEAISHDWNVEEIKA